MIFLAVDIGGTFTDLIAFDDRSGRFYQAKSLTTPRNHVDGIIDCIKKSDIDPKTIDNLIHGSTTAINTLIERKGAKVGLIVTRGTRDVYAIGRGNRPEAYNLFFHRPKPLVPRHLTLEANERLYASGEEREALDPASVRAACEAFAKEGVEAVAVCFLHSYANPEHEQQAGEIVEKALPKAYVSLSHEILREYREYERISTTVVNAYIGPVVGGYVRNLTSRLEGIGFKGELAIMQSNGGVMAPQTAIKRPVTMMESGPVGGIIASAEIGRALGYSNVVSFDMGGTTAKASLVREGEATHGRRLLCRRLRLGPSGDDAGGRRGRSRRRRRLDRLDRRCRRAQGRTAIARAPSRARSATAAAAPSRRSPTPMSFSAASARMTSSAAR